MQWWVANTFSVIQVDEPSGLFCHPDLRNDVASWDIKNFLSFSFALLCTWFKTQH
jgi:hypothetical protein